MIGISVMSRWTIKIRPFHAEARESPSPSVVGEENEEDKEEGGRAADYHSVAGTLVGQHFTMQTQRSLMPTFLSHLGFLPPAGGNLALQAKVANQ